MFTFMLLWTTEELCYRKLTGDRCFIYSPAQWSLKTISEGQMGVNRNHLEQQVNAAMFGFPTDAGRIKAIRGWKWRTHVKATNEEERLKLHLSNFNNPVKAPHDGYFPLGPRRQPLITIVTVKRDSYLYPQPATPSNFLQLPQLGRVN